MEDDDDAFLYGDDEPQGGAERANAEKGTKEADDGAQEAASKDAEEQDNEGDDDEDDDEDSDSDLEIIVEGSAGPPPPTGYNPRLAVPPAARPAPAQRPAPSAITSDYTPNARPGQTPSVSPLVDLASVEASTPAPLTGKETAPADLNNGANVVSISQLPEGPPPSVPITAPRLDLDPSEQSLLLPPETVEGEPGPLIYHVDPSAFEEKPWRRPGADLTDWFNYGFNEESWKLWGEKKHNRTKERGQMEANGGRHDGRVDDGDEQSELYRQQQQNDDGSSNYMSQMQPQQMQVMQAMMGASGLSMSPEQMMAFMGMGPGGVPGGMGMPGGGMMNNMPGMGAMFGGGGGGPQNANQGMFPNTFGGMPNMPKMHQPSPFQRGTPANGPFEGANEAGNDGGGLQQGDVNGGGIANESIKEGDGQTGNSSMDNAALGGEEPLRGARAGMTIQGRGAGVPGAPTGPSRGGPPPKGPSADRGANATAALPNNVPTGPKNPGRRYNDRDTGLGAADPLDYGGGQGGNRDDSDGRSPVVQRSGVPRSPGGRSSSLRRQQSNESREPSTERNRERESERERDWGDDGGNRSSRRARERTGERRRHGSTDDELERLARREQPSSRREQERGQRYSGGGGRRADYREERRKSDSVDRDDEWEKDSVASSASRRRASSRQQAAPSRSSGRADRRRGEADSGEDTERDRKHDRSQMRAERRAGRDGGDEAKQSGRKRNAPDDDHSPVRSTSSRKRR